MSSATSAKTTGHEIRPEIPDFDMKRWTLSVGRFVQAVIEQDQDYEYEESMDFVCKKVPPPTPDRREGRLFPPEQSWKTSTLLNELLAGGNKFYRKNSHMRQRRKSLAAPTCAGLARGF